MKIIDFTAQTFTPETMGYQINTTPSFKEIPSNIPNISLTFGFCNSKGTYILKPQNPLPRPSPLHVNTVWEVGIFCAFMGTTLARLIIEPNNPITKMLFHFGLLYAGGKITFELIHQFERHLDASRQLITTLEECGHDQIVDHTVLQRIENRLVHPSEGETSILCEGLLTLFQKNKPEHSPCRPLREEVISMWFKAVERRMQKGRSFDDTDTFQEYLKLSYAFLSPAEKRHFDRKLDHLCTSLDPHTKSLGCNVYYDIHCGAIDREGAGEGTELTSKVNAEYYSLRDQYRAKGGSPTDIPDNVLEDLATTIARIRLLCEDTLPKVEEKDQKQLLLNLLKTLQKLAERNLAKSTFSKARTPVQVYLKKCRSVPARDAARDFFTKISTHKNPRVRSHFADMYLAIYT